VSPPAHQFSVRWRRHMLWVLFLPAHNPVRPMQHDILDRLTHATTQTSS